MKARIISIGTAVPQTIKNNDHFAKYLDTSDEWITQRTGIKERRVWDNAPADAASELGFLAATKAIERAQISAESIDTVICATFTPDNFFPSTAALIAGKLGIKGAFAFDLSAACAGFTFGLSVADSLIRSGQSKRVLMVGSEVISRTLDWEDRGTCILFGDGAGAVIVEASEGEKGILSCVNYTDPSGAEHLALPSFGEKRFLNMEGTKIYKYACKLMPEMVEQALAKVGMSVADINLLIPHQANIRIIESVGERLGLSADKVMINLQKYGNTSSATIPLAMEEAWDGGRIKDGDIVALTSLGGGITAGGIIIRF
ncbi:MAG: ketoacyl-ACP synthase III [Chitinivibrionia bacterium]|nr:ketoacyl-ACP synthase III [Chitinivibrionia bacterium]